MHKEYRAEWASAGYAREMGSAEVVRPPPPEFIRAYHLTSADHAINNIALGRMKLARLSDLNDPFELLSLNFREQQVREIVRDFRSAYDTNTGLLSFSKNWTNPVPWSHYGDRHRGVCLGFDLRREDGYEEIEYTSSRIVAKLDENPNPNELSRELQAALVKTKFEHWSYEQEIRIMIPLEKASREESLYFYQFNDRLRLREVILGHLCKRELSTIRMMVSRAQPDAVTYGARLAFKSFGVVPKESTVA